MRKSFLFHLLFLLTSFPVMAQISLTGGTYTQDFNTLVNTTGSIANSLSIPGWLMTETGGGTRDNELYAVDAGTSNTGDTYSYGSAGSTERALGGLRSGSLIPLFGASFTNNTGSTVTSLTIAYTGEQWRLGTAGRQDSLGFEYSTNATGLSTGTWTTVTALTFISPTTTTVGAKDGNAAANRTARTHTITGLNIPDGATFYIRWSDYDVTGADDGLSVDDFSITPGSGAVTPVLSIADVSQAEGNSGNTDFVFTVSLSSPAGPGGVTFDIGTADNTATIIGNDYSGRSTIGATISAGNSSFTFTVQVVGETIPESNETFFVNVTNVTGATVGDAQGTGTILNDDVAITQIHDIQGPGLTSPIVGTSVTTTGIVTGLRSNGFFIQENDINVDADPLTSEGIFVFTGGAPPAAAAIGNLVQVTATVTEFVPGADPGSPPMTELTSPTVLQLTFGNPLPLPTTLTSANTDPAGSLSQLERFEGMRVLVNGLSVVAPTGGSITESSATSASNGLFYGVISLPRPLREPGINIQDPLPVGAPATVTRWDGNPEIISVSSNALGGPVIDVNAGAFINNLVGPLDFRNRFYSIDIEPAIPPVITNTSSNSVAVPTPNANELTVASFNLQRFYDNVDDPGGDAVLTATAYNNRLNKASLAIRNVLKTPDVLGVIEMENLTVLQTLANKINTDAVAAGAPNPNYVPFLVEGNDIGLIDVGFLVKSGRVTVNSVTQYGASTTYTNPNNGLPEILNDRPPLVLSGLFTGTGCVTNNDFMVIVNHLRSLNGVDNVIDGNRIRTKRQKQAEFLANLIQGFQTADPNVKIVSVGDYNAFEFNDGYVDVIGTIKGTPTPAANVTLASPDLVNPNLIDLVDAMFPAFKYTYTFEGSAQTLDHILVNPNMNARLSRFFIARLDADFPEILRNDPNRPERISDHDAPVAYFTFPTLPSPVLTCANDTTVASCQTQAAVNAAFANWLLTASGSGGLNGVLTYSTTTAPPACGGAVTVTFTYTNDCSPLTQNCTATFTVASPPAISISCPASVTVSCATAVPPVNTGGVTVNTGCGVTVTHISDVISAQTCANRYTITRTYRGTDICGNFNDCTQTITVNDQTAPVITCPAPVTVSCAANVPAPNTALVTATDNCAGAVIIAFVSDVISAQTCANRYTITRTYRATDVCGNSATCTQTITVNDQTPPTITCPAPVTVSCAANVPAPNTALVTATDNCAGAITITHISDVISNQTCANRYTVTRTYRATDVCGNFSECTQIITVNDQTPPTITCPAAITVSCASAVPAPNTALVTATDNCAGVVTITHVSDVITNQTCPNRYTLTRTYRATDVCGNFSECTQIITVNDQTAPVITCPANITVTTPVGSCTAVVNFTVTATDNCNGAVTIVSNPASGTAFPIGTTTVTSTATDACGNSSTCTFTVTVLDAQAPVITAQPQNVTVCVGQNATFSVSAVTAPSAGGPLSYQWQQWNGINAWVNIAGATAPTFTVNSVTFSMRTNTFRVVVTGLCTVVNSGAATLYVNQLPSITLSASPLTALLPNQTTNINALVNPTGGSFVWSLNGSVIPGATGPVLGPININGLGAYQAVYTDPNGCVNTAGPIDIKGAASDFLWVYPSPNTGRFVVRYDNLPNEKLTLEIYNPTGQLIISKTQTSGFLPYFRFDVDVRNQVTGYFLVRVINERGKVIAGKWVLVTR